MAYARKKGICFHTYLGIIYLGSCNYIFVSIDTSSIAFLNGANAHSFLTLRHQMKCKQLVNRCIIESNLVHCFIISAKRPFKVQVKMRHAKRSRAILQAVSSETREEKKPSIFVDLTSGKLENENQLNHVSSKQIQDLATIDSAFSQQIENRKNLGLKRNKLVDPPEQEIASIWDDNFHLLCWNLDGLDERFLKLRTDYVIDMFKKLKPGVIFLQEVIDPSLDLLKRKLSNDYQFILPKDTCGLRLPYFCVILLAYEQILCYEGSEFTYWYPRTKMGRHLLRVCGRPLNRPDECIQFLTTHLESTWQFGKERKSQFKQALDFISSNKNHENFNVSTSIFGGDLNIVDSELVDIDFHEGFEDAWKVVGSPKECQFTWDLSLNDNIENTSKRKPRRRFDRIYCCNPQCDLGSETKCAATWKPTEVKLLGKERISSCGLFPSDHFGLLFKFKRFE